ncbi:MAG: septum formation protein Maf [Verrucomicrobia bacterium]|nr:MAG: septum formation protein Maf [Verrucomicrobiota bacterium]
MSLVLASGSPRRRDLLAQAGLVFDVVVSPAEEIHDPTLPPDCLCEGNAKLKAAAVALSHPHATVIGADTLVFIDADALGKPADLDEARAMLRRLSGRAHIVCTGVCVIRPGGSIHTFHELSEVVFRVLDEAAIDAYFLLVNPLDKAGAYGIQAHGERIVAEIRGNIDNVMGLPVTRLLEVLGTAGHLG